MTAKKIAKELLDDDYEKTYKHTKRVVELCEKFIRAGLSVNAEMLLDAAWLHDVAKAIDAGKEHHKPKVVREALKGYKVKDLDNLVGIIENHKGGFSPKAYELESAVLRICDKLDKYSQADCKCDNEKFEKAAKKFREAAEKCNASMMKIKAALDSNTWSAFEDAYGNILANILE